jgi:DNA-3-methyladenine glycosylase
MILPRRFYARDTALVARELLGKVLEHGGCAGKITETEAYYGLGDPASHAHNGPTPRSAMMWGKPGTAYVYFCYGSHWLLNIVTEREGKPGAVLIRAIEPVNGIAAMRRRRKGGDCNGPGKVTQALAITGRHNGGDVVNGPIRVLDAPKARNVGAGGRIGITKGKARQLRFFIKTA